MNTVIKIPIDQAAEQKVLEEEEQSLQLEAGEFPW